MTVGLAAHVVAAVAQVWITRFYYGGGDMLSYHRTGSALARVVRMDPERFLPEVMALILQRDANLPVTIFGRTASASMQGISGLLCLGLDDSIYAACLLLALLSYFGQVALYRVFRDVFDERLQPRLLIACFLLPSVVFWSSGLLKEAVAFPGFCLVIYGLNRLMGGAPFRGLVLVLIGAVPVALTKPYILVALSIAAATWWYWRRTMRKTGAAVVIRPLYLLLGVGMVIGAVALLGNLFPRYAFDNLADETAQLQGIGAQVEGGSNYSIGDSSQRGLLGQLAFVPLALVTALFRPFVFEVSGAPMLVNALETTVLTFLLGRAILRQSFKRVWNFTTASPLLLFSVVFTLSFGAAVGLASTNLGSLSRYRLPLVPFFTLVVLIWDGLPRGGIARSRNPASARNASIPVRGARATAS